MNALERPGLSLDGGAIRALADPAMPIGRPLFLAPAKPLTLKQINDFWKQGQIMSPHEVCR